MSLFLFSDSSFPRLFSYANLFSNLSGVKQKWPLGQHLSRLGKPGTHSALTSPHGRNCGPGTSLGTELCHPGEGWQRWYEAVFLTLFKAFVFGFWRGCWNFSPGPPDSHKGIPSRDGCQHWCFCQSKGWHLLFPHLAYITLQLSSLLLEMWLDICSRSSVS